MKTIGLLGFGRFGQVFVEMLGESYHVDCYDPAAITSPNNRVHFVDLAQAASHQTVVLAVPIRHFETAVQAIAPHLAVDATVMDVCSVKVHPVAVMRNVLPDSVGIIATHPMFGPDSILENRKLNVMMSATRDLHHQFEHWKQFYCAQQIQVIEMTPEQHDQQAAMSQGLTHFIGRVMAEIGATPTAIDTLGFKRLLQVMEQTCHDSWELFCDLQNYNPYSTEMSDSLANSIRVVQQKLSLNVL